MAIAYTPTEVLAEIRYGPRALPWEAIETGAREIHARAAGRRIADLAQVVGARVIFIPGLHHDIPGFRHTTKSGKRFVFVRAERDLRERVVIALHEIAEFAIGDCALHGDVWHLTLALGLLARDRDRAFELITDDDAYNIPPWARRERLRILAAMDGEPSNDQGSGQIASGGS